MTVSRVAEMNPARHMLDGTIRVFFADALILPTGMLTVVYLTRRLGPDGFGLFAIAAAIVLWVESSINTVFHRPTLRIIADRKNSPSVWPTVVRMHLRVSGIAMLLLCLLSPLIAAVLHQQQLTTCLWLFSLDIP